jgi:hypothetical protein
MIIQLDPRTSNTLPNLLTLNGYVLHKNKTISYQGIPIARAVTLRGSFAFVECITPDLWPEAFQCEADSVMVYGQNNLTGKWLDDYKRSKREAQSPVYYTAMEHADFFTDLRYTFHASSTLSYISACMTLYGSLLSVVNSSKDKNALFSFHDPVRCLFSMYKEQLQNFFVNYIGDYDKDVQARFLDKYIMHSWLVNDGHGQYWQILGHNELPNEMSCTSLEYYTAVFNDHAKAFQLLASHYGVECDYTPDSFYGLYRNNMLYMGQAHILEDGSIAHTSIPTTMDPVLGEGYVVPVPTNRLYGHKNSGHVTEQAKEDHRLYGVGYNNDLSVHNTVYKNDLHVLDAFYRLFGNCLSVSFSHTKNTKNI